MLFSIVGTHWRLYRACCWLVLLFMVILRCNNHPNGQQRRLSATTSVPKTHTCRIATSSHSLHTRAHNDDNDAAPGCKRQKASMISIFSCLATAASTFDTQTVLQSSHKLAVQMSTKGEWRTTVTATVRQPNTVELFQHFW
jgi:hypothetical protein